MRQADQSQNPTASQAATSMTARIAVVAFIMVAIMLALVGTVAMVSARSGGA